jgi:hypothetical protein
MKSWKLTELKYLRENLHLTDKKLAEHFGVSDTTITSTRKRHNIFRQDTQFVKGQTPWNKGIHFFAGGRSVETQFKKGQATARRPIGEVFSIRDATKKTYLFIKTENHRQYPYGRFVWEQTTGEKLNRDEVIRFKDSNQQNCSFDNLQKVTRKENALMNVNRKKAAQTMRGKKIGILKALQEMGFIKQHFIKTA